MARDSNAFTLSGLNQQSITDVIRNIDFGPSAELPIDPGSYPTIQPLPDWTPPIKPPPKLVLPPDIKLPTFPKPSPPSLPGDFEEVVKAKLMKFNALRQQPVKSKLHFELWLAAVFRSLGQARTASADWLSLSTSLSAYDIQLKEIALRVFQVNNEEIPRLAFEEKDLKRSRAQLKIQKKRTIQKIKNLELIFSDRTENNVKLRLASRLRNEFQSKRDPLPDGKTSFIDTPAPEEYKVFVEKEQKSYLSCALVAARVEDELSNGWSLALLKDEINSAQLQLTAINHAIASIDEKSDDIQTMRQKSDEKLSLLADQQFIIVSFLADSASNLSERQATVVARYILAIRDLRARAWSLIESINVTLDKALPKEVSHNLLVSLQGDEADRGENLIEVEGLLSGIQEWVEGISQRMTRESLIFSLEVQK